MKQHRRFALQLAAAGAILALLILSCTDSEGPLAPYVAGGNPLSKITVEPESFRPQITWVGGYVSVFGINRGTSAVLDSTLLWLVYASGDNLHFPTKFGVTPTGAQNLTASYGGSIPDSLYEDSTYTIWIMKEDAWSTVTANAGKVIVEDTSLASSAAAGTDTVRVSTFSHNQLTDTIDVFINLTEVRSLGGLAIVVARASNVDNHPRVTWTMRTVGADSLVAALGTVAATQYDVNSLVWEVLSVDSSGGSPAYRSKNVMGSPLVMGQSFPETVVFTPYPAAGLERGKQYLFWIANKDWDGIGHARSTPNHAYVTFRTW